MSHSARKALRRTSGVAAVAAALAVPGAASAATTVYPNGGSTFATNAQGWAGSGASCSPALLCASSTPYTPGAGSPPGSITARAQVVANLLSLIRGRSTYTSPNFVVPAGPAVSGASFSLDRSLVAPGAIDLGLASTYSVRLVDRTANTATTLTSETLDIGNATFARRSVGVPSSRVVAGHTYAIQISTDTTTRIVALNPAGSFDTRYDNVRLSLSRTGVGPIGGGALGSDGGNRHGSLDLQRELQLALEADQRERRVRSRSRRLGRALLQVHDRRHAGQ